ncbi:unnamed protein product [Acanthoscelides obtectus]|uniref:Uncharacterized protein n=1 Tax=Acanthoscelides obtectus TaxID=200917 RepID=A0A9P0JRX6_ACAOB|nr:unnamed protein product [Acanthoscelides obtectus]CAK1668998.1 hypothetical protein AOBTE_LOCUS26730 [Acanthoscelides obtectus]
MKAQKPSIRNNLKMPYSDVKEEVQLSQVVGIPYRPDILCLGVWATGIVAMLLARAMHRPMFHLRHGLTDLFTVDL